MRQCPSPTELEIFVTDKEVDPAIGEHVARCAVCRESVDEIRANQRFVACGEAALAAAFDAAKSDESHSTALRPMPPDGTVPGFRLVEEISRGGQGIVYRAIQSDSKRLAAVKMLLAGAFASGRQRQRFEREIEIAARLRHPSIVSVFGSGVTSDGRRYVAMEYVSGKPLDRFVRERLPLKGRGGRARTDQIMRLVQLVADGVGHAHASGVMHRDLKPSNILVDAEGKPRVLDFGLARSSESEHGATVTHEFAGTVAYAAPEQFSSTAGLVSTRADVYSLGLVLYTALTGTHPYPCEGSIAEVSKHVLTTEPAPPSRFVPRLPSDVETIVLKALSKDPSRRYPSAGAMASDIDDYLNGRPISARRDSTMYVLRTLAMKHRVPAAAAALALVTVVAAAIGLAVLASDLSRSQRNTASALSESRVQRARLMGAAGDLGQAESLLWADAVDAGMTTDESLCVGGSAVALRSAWSLAELYSRLPRLFRATWTEYSGHVRLDPSARTVWVVDKFGSRWTWNLEGRLVDRTPAVLAAGGGGTMLSPNGRYAVLSVSDSYTLLDLRDAAILAGPIARDPQFDIGSVSDDGNTLACQRLYFDQAGQRVGDRAVRLLEARTGALLAEFDDHTSGVYPLSSPAGLCVLVGTHVGNIPSVLVRQAPDWRVVRTITAPAAVNAQTNMQQILRPTSDGTLLLAGVGQTLVRFNLAPDQGLDLGTGVFVRRSPAAIEFLGVDELGVRVAAGSLDGTVMVHDVRDLSLALTIPNGQQITGLALCADLNVVAVCDNARRLSVYEASDRPWLQRVPSSDLTTGSVAVAPDGTIATGDDHGMLVIRPGRAPNEPISIRAHDRAITSVAFSPDGAEVVTCGFDGAVRIWRADGSAARTVASGRPNIWSARFSPDGRTIAWGERGGLVQIRRDTLEPEALTLDCRAIRIAMVAFSPDGGAIASAALTNLRFGPGVVRVWDLASGRQIHELRVPSNYTRVIAFSPDGGWIVCGHDDRTLTVWDAKTGSKLRTIPGLPWLPYDLKFDPGGRVLFVVGGGGEVVAVDPAAGVELGKLNVHEKPIFSLAASSDGRLLYTAGEDPWIGITDLHRLRSYIRGNEGYWRQTMAGGK